MATARRDDPYRGFNFEVQIDNTTIAAFSEVSGLSFSAEPVEYREGTDVPLNPRKLTGLRKFANISLKRGFTNNVELWNWYKNVLNGVTDRRNGAIILRDEQHNDVLRWNFENGFLSKWEGPSLNANSNNVVLESVEICVERVELV
jgi:phage tail-like protein